MDLFLQSVENLKLLERLNFDSIYILLFIIIDIMFTDQNINHLCLSLHSLSNLKDLIFKSIFYIFIIFSCIITNKRYVENM